MNKSMRAVSRLTGIFAIFQILGSAAHAAAPAALTVDKGDTAWMLTATILVLLMILPGLALFYGGLVRSKNMLSVLSQILGITAVVILVWVGWGYSLAFDAGSPVVGGTGKLFLSGITGDSMAATFSEGVGIPELVFVAFQMTFAAITAALIVGSLVERVKFSAMLLFSVIWATIVYAPIAHMVWASDGLIFGMGALDFAGGTVVHINAGIAGLVGVFFAGKRIGFLKESTPPHSLVMTLIGTGLLWVGWFGFNAGSNLEATGGAAIAMINTFVAPAAGVLAWLGAERVFSGKASLLGGASGAIAGLVAVTPAAGTSGVIGAILLGAVAALVCYWFVATVKNRLKLDDTLDVFGIHGIGGIVGSIGTGIVTAPIFGGFGAEDFSIASQVVIQFQAVAIAIAWSAIGSAVAFAIVKAVLGLRVASDAEREGLDITDHGERAYNF
ncbi:ammonium transporter [Sphingosinicella rhizophila]|uniref:Ammonium transporter n=1 Tax=Sphingosinicella rhizophila TaxID=3050082 RepID=A0ABU3Q974_9SPHN|nr:ammonium transporter [Sphingosinicella sp. GR2756]MDT9599951.1 ammonium transporter [Sphingosinicella sp. GR2756]